MNKLLTANKINWDLVTPYQSDYSKSQTNLYNALTFAIIIIAIGVFIYLVSKAIRKK